LDKDERAISALHKYPGEFEGQRPSSPEEKAQADDETKDSRASAPLINRWSGSNPLALRSFGG
jgi:hypothetical protein